MGTKEEARNGGYIVTWAEVAAVLGVSERTARRWSERHGLPVQRVGGLVAIKRGALRLWLEHRPHIQTDQI